MGNSIPLLSTEPLDARSCIQKLPGSKIVQEEVLCDRRFMKSFRSKRDNESLVVKVYYTGDADEGDLDEAESILLEQRDKFSKNSNAFNVIPYQSYVLQCCFHPGADAPVPLTTDVLSRHSVWAHLRSTMPVVFLSMQVHRAG